LDLKARFLSEEMSMTETHYPVGDSVEKCCRIDSTGCSSSLGIKTGGGLTGMMLVWMGNLW